MRCFIALEIPQPIKDSLQVLQEYLKTSQADVRWVKPESMHLTLRFLGNIETSGDMIESRSDIRVPGLKQVQAVLDAVAKEHSALSLSVAGAGAFPSTQSPKVVWAGIEQGKEELIALAKTLNNALAAAGFSPEENPFSPHITLGRVRSRKFRQGLTNAIEKSSWRIEDDWKVAAIKLYQSELTPEGPLYSELYVTPLQSLSK